MDRPFHAALVSGWVLLYAAMVSPVVGAPLQHARSDAYVLPASGTQVLTDTDLMGLTAAELRLARNEIYARHGCLFRDPALTEYFAEKTWYNPVAGRSATNFDSLTDTERYNVSLIRAYEGLRQPPSAADADGSAGGVKMMTDEELDRLLGLQPDAGGARKKPRKPPIPASTVAMFDRIEAEQRAAATQRSRRPAASTAPPHPPEGVAAHGWPPPTPGELARLERELQEETAAAPPSSQAPVEPDPPARPIRSLISADTLSASLLGLLGGLTAGVAIAMMLIRRREQRTTAPPSDVGETAADPPRTPAEQPVGEPTVASGHDAARGPAAEPAGTAAMDTDKQCPKCGLVRHDSALQCDCGYDFASGTMQGSYLPPEQRPIRWSMRAWVLSLLFATLGMSVAAGNHLGALFIVLLGWAGGLLGRRIAQAIDASGRSQRSKSGFTLVAGLGGCLFYLALFALLAVAVGSSHLSGR